MSLARSLRPQVRERPPHSGPPGSPPGPPAPGSPPGPPGAPGSPPAPAARPDLPRLGQRAPDPHGCDMCGESFSAGGSGGTHRHLVDSSARRLLCCCPACALLFCADGAGKGRYLPVPDTYRALGGPPLAPNALDPLGIPVGTAFFFHDTASARMVAFYPSPAGATESLLDISAWAELLADHPDLADLEPDTQALLVHRRDGGLSGYLVPIDACYELVGLVRKHWKGLDGGEEAHRAIGEFFAEVDQRCRDGGR
jgi:hypothetical protein